MSAWQVLRETPRRLSRAAAQPRPQLRGLPRPPRRLSTVWFSALMVGILVGGTVGLLFFITFLQSQAFEVKQAQQQAAELGYEVSDLEARVNAAQSPVELARRATNLGMVPYNHGVFIDLETGTVVGDPVPASKYDVPGLLVNDPARVPTSTSEAAGTAAGSETAAGTDDAADQAADADADTGAANEGATDAAPTESTQGDAP